MAVVVKNACKDFAGTQVLCNLNLSVKSGTIYGLLGASGCGKTTLLSCIVGLKSLDTGEIFVFGKRPGESGSGIPGPRIGFMPQETALYPVFRIDEVLHYYGTILGVCPKTLQKRMEFLSEFLELPDRRRMVPTLSGGQLRRVSLAAALIHQPPLIILDEPTVGLDPVLRQSIWEHLTTLASGSNPITVIITTHYLDEAKQCDTIGVMRRGRLLCEESPISLMDRFDISDSLDDAVLSLCRDDESNRISETSWRGNDSGGKWPKLKRLRRLSSFNNNDENTFNPEISDESFSLKTNDWDIIKSLAKKNFLIQIRHPVSIATQLFLPVIVIVLYNMIMGKNPIGMNVGFVSKDWEFESRENGFQALLQFCETAKGQCFSNKLTPICTFFQMFEENEINWVQQRSRNEALNLIHQGNAIGFIEIPQNFSSNLAHRLAYRNFATNETIDGSTINLKMDLTDSVSSFWLAGNILKRYFEFAKQVAINCGQDPNIVDLPLKTNPIYGSNEGSEWVQFMQPGLIIIFMIILSTGAGLIYVIEKRMGIADRGVVVGIKFRHIIGACLISDTLTMFGQTAIFLSLANFYGMRVEGSWLTVIGIVITTSLSGMALGFLWAAFANHEVEVVNIQLFFDSFLLISSGFIWPLESVPKWYRTFCYILPTSAPIIAMRAVIFRGWGLDHPVVLQGFAASLFWILIPFLLGSLAHLRRK